MLSWLVIIIAVVIIFNADKLPQWKKTLEEKTKEGVNAVKKGQKIAQEKISQAKAKKDEKEDK